MFKKVFRKEGKSASKVTSSAKDGAGNESELIEIEQSFGLFRESVHTQIACYYHVIDHRLISFSMA